MSKDRTQKKRKKRTGLRVIAVIILLVILALLAGIIWYRQEIRPTGDASDVVKIEVSEGESRNELLEDLKEKDLIRSVPAAKIASRLQKNTAHYAGSFTLNKGMNTPEILSYLSDQANIDQNYAVITIPEGYWAKQIAETLAAQLPNHTEQEFLDLWNNQDYIQTLSQDYSFLDPERLSNPDLKVKLEGYLFPETYYVEYNSSADQITRIFLDQFKKVYDQYADEIAVSGYSLEDLLTLASVVQFESGDPAVMPDIARVFYNRLDQSMNLGSSVTVCYALYEDFESYQDCEVNPDIDSPYNTYLHAGLPAGPVDNPGEEALKAVLEPADNDYLYFVADIHGDGAVHFATTAEEHQANVEKYNLTIE